MSQIVFVVTAWDEDTNKDTVLVFRDKSKADQAWAALEGESVFGGVVRRSVKT